MILSRKHKTFKEGDWVLISYKNKNFLKKLEKGFNLNVKKEVIKFEDIIGKKEGEEIKGFQIFRPTLEEIILFGLKRKTQIIYPKDSFFIAFKLDLSRKSKVLEVGVGSGALTVVLSRLAKEVFAYEISKKFCKLALKNWQKFDLCQNVKLFNEDFLEAKIRKNFFDAAFVDVKEPWHFVEKLHWGLKEGKTVGFLLPTTNQVSKLLESLKGFFGSVEVLEILHRYYKVVPERIRPEDRMVAHTGYLVFAKKTQKEK